MLLMQPLEGVFEEYQDGMIQARREKGLDGLRKSISQKLPLIAMQNLAFFLS
jgi:hypothetical protein